MKFGKTNEGACSLPQERWPPGLKLRAKGPMGEVAVAAKKHGKVFGMHGPDALLERWLPKGLTLVMSNADTIVSTVGLRAIC